VLLDRWLAGVAGYGGVLARSRALIGVLETG
jgi:hypothetical protein